MLSGPNMAALPLLLSIVRLTWLAGSRLTSS
jgi:hypothetical protein